MQEKGLGGRKSQQCRRLFIEGKARSGVGSPEVQLTREGHPVVILSGVGGAKEEHPTALRVPSGGRQATCGLWPREASSRRPQVSVRWRPGIKQEIAGQGNQRKGEVSRNPTPTTTTTNLLKLRAFPSLPGMGVGHTYQGDHPLLPLIPRGGGGGN